jgi:F-type H+-transporting ATPase subunit alpha
LAQYQELAAFAQFAQDLDKATKAKIDRGSRLMELLKQGQFEPMPMEEQVVVLFAGNEGYLDNVALEQVHEFEKKLIQYLKDHYAKILETIRDSRDLSDETKAELKKALESIDIIH